jgi:hypothetical protein
MPIVVIRQSPSEVAVRSVGENLSPLPLLSVGASVSIEVPLCKWVVVHLSAPLYVMVAVISLFLKNK